jgi:hypothetical protein
MSAREDDVTTDPDLLDDDESDEGLAPPTGSLEAEGIPEIQGPAPGQELGDDGDEGFVPPGDAPWAADRDDVTASAQREGSTLDERLALEEPDGPPREAAERGLDVIDEDRPDHEAELVGSGADAFEGAPAEELAMHVTDEAPGATDDDDDGYVAQDGGMAP